MNARSMIHELARQFTPEQEARILAEFECECGETHP